MTRMVFRVLDDSAAFGPPSMISSKSTGIIISSWLAKAGDERQKCMCLPMLSRTMRSDERWSSEGVLEMASSAFGDFMVERQNMLLKGLVPSLEVRALLTFVGLTYVTREGTAAAATRRGEAGGDLEPEVPVVKESAKRIDRGSPPLSGPLVRCSPSASG